MLHSKARWQTGCAESSVVQKLAEAHHLDTLTARLLALRGITTPEAAESFLHSRQDGFHDPFYEGYEKSRGPDPSCCGT
ncbi:hypothetical protein P7H25_08080 [Paenibacillus larvae]|nr:hypothetical protein [Paenibacillus larvae]MDT2255612.1 hypothetical protein [Paenibacillus larvae]